MSTTASAPPAGRQDLAAEEWELRKELAACYRLIAHFGWDDLLSTHVSARLAGATEFLLNPRGLLFEEITASSLVKIDFDGRVVGATPSEVNRAGFVIHSAVHMVRPDVRCVIHLHTLDGMAVSAFEGGLLPLTQQAIGIGPDLALHEYEGIAFDLDERTSLQRDLGSKHLMLLRNHGTLAAGPSVGAAFYLMYLLERSCTAQVRARAMATSSADVHRPPPETLTKVPEQADSAWTFRMADDHVWPALRRKADRVCSGYEA
jgi:ribulose-5-phosphate 4-epimerase/fuculose-1-phosphate aldolase